MGAPVIDATVGGANANSYLTLAEAQAYFDTRLPVAGWDDADDQNVLLIMATRTLDRLLTPYKTLFTMNGRNYYRVRPQWTGAAATQTQRLAWPRTGMFDANGFAIASNVIPEDLKFATAEIRRSPWRLLYKPRPGEVANSTLFDAARDFAEGANDMSDAATALRDALKDPKADPKEIQKLMNQLDDSFGKFTKVEDELWKRVKE